MLEQELLRYGYLVLFFGVVVEGDAFLVPAGFLAHRGYLNLLAVIAVAALANTAADQLYYQLARSKGSGFFQRKAASDPRYERVRAWVARRGVPLLFFSRFMYGFRIAVPAACGAAGMPPGVFFWTNLAGGLFWATLGGVLGYIFGSALPPAFAGIWRYEWGAAIVILVVVAVVLARRSQDVRKSIALLRRPAEVASELALGVFTVAHRAGRLLMADAPARLAFFVVALGALNVSSALLRWHLLRLDALAAWLPFEVTHGSRALMLLAGLGLMAVGRGLARRKQLAWMVATGMTAISILLHLGHHASILRAAASLVLLVELLRNRRRFQARSDPLRLRHALVAAPVLALAITTFGCVGLFELSQPDFSLSSAITATWQAALFQDVPPIQADPHAGVLMTSLQVLTVFSIVYLLMALLAPVAFTHEAPANRAPVQDLAWQYGLDSMSYFAKQDDKRHFLVGTRALVAYRVANRVAIVAGDPIGPSDAIPDAIAAFVDHCRVNDWIPVFYETSERYLDLYLRHGLRRFKVGEEAILPLHEFSMQGGKVAKVRQAINKIERETPGLTVTEYTRTEVDPEIDAQLEEISEEWLRGKKVGEIGFNLGIFSVEDLADKRTMLAITDAGYVWAFLTWVPYRGGRGVNLDAMRRRDAAPFGVMDLLIARSALQFKQEGLEEVSLAVAPLANVDVEEGRALSGYDRAVKLLFDHFSAVYGYRSLFQFKKKFGPRWASRYLVFPRPDQLPRVTYALIKVHTGRGLLSLMRGS